MNDYETILKQYGIEDKDRLFLTIKNDFLDDMRLGVKNVEYRNNTEFFRRKLFVKGADGLPSRTVKPLKYVLFQGGYEPDSPRLLIELKGWNIGEEFFPSDLDIKGHDIYTELICLLLGRIIYDSQGGVLYSTLKGAGKKVVKRNSGSKKKSKKITKSQITKMSTGSVTYTYIETKHY